MKSYLKTNNNHIFKHFRCKLNEQKFINKNSFLAFNLEKESKKIWVCAFFPPNPSAKRSN
jgi:hypothetical protein